MPEQRERPRPHGDPLADEIDESNGAQRQTDAPPGVAGSDKVEDSTGSASNGVPAANETDGKRRRDQSDKGAGLVSRIH